MSVAAPSYYVQPHWNVGGDGKNVTAGRERVEWRLAEIPGHSAVMLYSTVAELSDGAG